MVRMRSRFRGVLLAAVAIGTLAPLAPAYAQAQRRIEYNIAAGDLGEALKTVSRQSGKEIIFTSEAVLERPAPALQGTYSADEAVRLLLRGSDLVAQFRRDVIIVRGRSEPSGAVVRRSADDADIVVTGSHIRGAETIAKPTTTSRASIELQGIADLGTFARSIPQNFSGGQNPGVIGSGTGGENVNSSSTLNLRGLGPDATLTLINGHRVAYDSAVQGVDISLVPLLAVEKVEVLAEGSSALYGSDAVGGVANIMLRRKFDGLSTAARFGGTTDGGYAQTQLSAIAGVSSDRSGAYLAGEYNKSTAITAKDRSYTSTLNGTATLFPAQRQFSIVGSGYFVARDSLRFEVDGQFSDRTSSFSNPSLSETDVWVNGVYSDRHVSMFAVSPRVVMNIGSRWQLQASGTYSKSNTDNDLINFISSAPLATLNVKYHNGLRAAELAADGQLFELPGGPAKLAVGAGIRSISLDGTIDLTFAGATRRTLDISASRTASYAYGELFLPLIGPANGLPFAHTLNISGALRYEKYKNGNGLVTPKLGFVLAPSRDITLRSSWGKSFKAPTLYQEYSALNGYLLPADTFLPNAPGGLPAIVLSGGNRTLSAEKATSWTTSMAFTPSFAPGLILEASYFRLHYRNRVAEPISNLSDAFGGAIPASLIILSPTRGQVETIASTIPTGITNQTGAPFDIDRVGAILDYRLQNLARQNVEGVDLNLKYEIDLNGGMLSFLGNASYLESKQQLNSAAPLIDRAGTIFNPPHWRGRTTIAWDKKVLTLASVISFIGGTRDTRFADDEHVGSFVTVDFTAKFRPDFSRRLLHGTEISASLLNMFNEKPAVIRTTNSANPPFDSTNYSSIGRAFGITVSKVW